MTFPLTLLLLHKQEFILPTAIMRPMQNNPVVIPSLRQQAWESLVIKRVFEIATALCASQ